jgi:hypothetical protein
MKNICKWNVEKYKKPEASKNKIESNHTLSNTENLGNSINQHAHNEYEAHPKVNSIVVHQIKGILFYMLKYANDEKEKQLLSEMSSMIMNKKCDISQRDQKLILKSCKSLVKHPANKLVAGAKQIIQTLNNEQNHDFISSVLNSVFQSNISSKKLKIYLKYDSTLINVNDITECSKSFLNRCLLMFIEHYNQHEINNIFAIIDNLINNAIKHANQYVIIQIFNPCDHPVTQANHIPLIKVHDDGNIIEPQEIFNRRTTNIYTNSSSVGIISSIDYLDKNKLGSLSLTNYHYSSNQDGQPTITKSFDLSLDPPLKYKQFMKKMNALRQYENNYLFFEDDNFQINVIIELQFHGNPPQQIIKSLEEDGYALYHCNQHCLIYIQNPILIKVVANFKIPIKGGMIDCINDLFTLRWIVKSIRFHQNSKIYLISALPIETFTQEIEMLLLAKSCVGFFHKPIMLHEFPFTELLNQQPKDGSVEEFEKSEKLENGNVQNQGVSSNENPKNLINQHTHMNQQNRFCFFKPSLPIFFCCMGNETNRNKQVFNPGLNK